MLFGKRQQVRKKLIKRLLQLWSQTLNFGVAGCQRIGPYDTAGHAFQHTLNLNLIAVGQWQVIRGHVAQKAL